MALSDTNRLYDIATRQQVYIEGVKLGFARDFNYVLAQLNEELKKLLGRVKYKTLDGLTKAELLALTVKLRRVQSELFSQYTDQILDQLKEFMSADAEVSRRIFATSIVELDDDTPDMEPLPDEGAEAVMEGTAENDSNVVPIFGIPTKKKEDRLWSSVLNAPIPANGIYLIPFLKGFSVSAQAGIENVIRKAWSNGWTLEETVAELTGQEAVQGASSQLQRIAVQNSAVVSTAVAHVAAIVGAAVQSSMFAQYAWFSVMDGRTTEICASRNLHIYRYGHGPLPPAHIRCRSHISPILGGRVPRDPEMFFAWLQRQPESVQDDILGAEAARAFRSGKVKAKDMPKYEASRPLSINAFRAKVLEIMSR